MSAGMVKIFNAVAITGQTRDKETGKAKNRTARVGIVYQREDGTWVLKLDLLPVAFTGWVNFYPPDAERDAAREPGTPGEADF
jgi:hypothetical protein